MDHLTQNKLPFFRRFLIYQKERFPFLVHGLLVASFSFSAISYSRISRGVSGFISWENYIIAIVTTISLFFLVRVLDEFKDAEDDAKYRQELPVPRGLINFNELKWMAITAIAIQLVVNTIFAPKMLWLYLLIMVYLFFMTKEFFIKDWLKKHQFWYVTSHMFIIPFIDIYASSFDWLNDGVSAPKGLLFFFIVSYLNGIVLEIGRKIRVTEKEGVLTYSSMLGSGKATWLWIIILFCTLCASVLASYYAGYGETGLLVLLSLFILCFIPGLLFLKNKTEKNSKLIEIASGLWTLGMYFILGAIPMIAKIIS